MSSKKGISTTLVAGIVVAIIVIAAIGVYYYYFLMPTPEPEEPVYPIATASSLQYSVDITYNDTGTTDTFTYYMKNMDTGNITMRIEMTVDAVDYVVIADQENRSMWMNVYGVWSDLSADFDAQWDLYMEAIDDYLDIRLAEWTEGDVTYTDSEAGQDIKIHDITVDPVFEDSLFEVSS